MILEFPICEPLTDLTEDGLNYRARFPESAWDAGYFAQLALLEFAREDWQDLPVEGPPNVQYADGRDTILQEIDNLSGLFRRSIT